MAYVPPSKRTTRAIKNSFRKPQKPITDADTEFPVLSPAAPITLPHKNAKVWEKFRFDPKAPPVPVECQVFQQVEAVPQPQPEPEEDFEDIQEDDISSHESDDPYHTTSYPDGYSDDRYFE